MNSYFLVKSDPENYMQPFVVIRLNVTNNVEVNVKCAAWAENIEINEKNNRGSTKFSVTVNS
jgi:hypothetical protein